jgi:hypothetical protein
MAEILPPGVLRPALTAIDRYGLIPQDEPVMVAFSGGKDSLLLAMILTELKIPLICVSVDMGYENGWAERIKELARVACLPIDVVSPRKNAAFGNERTKRNLMALDLLPAKPAGPVTPCTHCYDVKVTAFHNAAVQRGLRTVAFGHHHTDAVASLLKEALMFIDRWDDDHHVFRRDNFAALVERLHLESQDSAASGRPLLSRVTELVTTGTIDTDEPPRQPLNRDVPEISLVRPMFLLAEEKIARTIGDLGLPTEGSGCGHGAAANYLTPREMVHYRVLHRNTSAWFADHMYKLVLHGINTDGTARTQARHRRAALLGSMYKPTATGLDKP